jgi:DNA polymerase-3 subunit delta'
MVGVLSGLPHLDVPSVHAFADKSAKGDESFRTLSELFAWWIAGAVAGSCGTAADRGEVVAGEIELQRRLVNAANLDRWVEVWEKTTHLFSRADAINLDRKQVILNAFFALEDACRS